jgi:lysophospholipase L1-like esterase
MLTKKQKDTPKWFYFILILFPIALLIIIEVSLRLFNYGNDYTEWVSIDNKYEILNPDIAGKYFSGITNLPYSTESFLLKEKPKDAFRIITLGASSGAGYPYQNSGSFTKYIRKSLAFAFPNQKFEIANISMTAINSYTILDLLPGIIEKKPDLVLVYLGHNEFYGALGAGSNQGIGSSRFATNLILKFKKIKIYQLLENLVVSVQTLFNSKKNISDGTLMSNIAREKLIEFNSELFNSGVAQFEGNLNDIFALCKENNIPAISGTLVSNLKDLKPFNSIDNRNGESANIIFNKAKEAYVDTNFYDADALFRLAKDLDGLRFRAPEKFNEVIYNLSAEYEFNVVNIDSIINSESKNGIVGNELLVDHLHPNLLGYQIIGKSFFEAILKSGLIQEKQSDISNYKIDSLVKSDYNFTRYDSSVAEFRIKILKNDWPFTDSKQITDKKELLKSNTLEEKIAFDVLEGRISRLDGRLKIADSYKNQSQINLYVKEILALTEEFPTHKYLLNSAAEKLIKSQNYLVVGKLLKQSYKLEPDAFNTKWLGIMSMANNEFDSAIKYLRDNTKFNTMDPQIYFNLAGAYFKKENFTEAYKYIIECLKINPNYKNADVLKRQVENILN